MMTEKKNRGPKPRQNKSSRTLVRCLGPGSEHTFMSSNPTYHRVCSRCTDLIRGDKPEYKTPSCRKGIV